jgi:hypothetical protein
MQTPIEETVAIIAQLEQLAESLRSHLSQEAKDNLEAVEGLSTQPHRKQDSQKPA